MFICLKDAKEIPKIRFKTLFKECNVVINPVKPYKLVSIDMLQKWDLLSDAFKTHSALVSHVLGSFLCLNPSYTVSYV